MKIIRARILGDGKNLSIEYEKDGELMGLIISLENVIKSFELADLIKTTLILQEETGE